MQHLSIELLSLILLILVGVTLKRVKLVCESTSLVKIINYVTMPTLILYSILTSNIRFREVLVILIVAFVHRLLMFSVSYTTFSRLGVREKWILTLLSTVQNAIYLPLPIAFILWGNRGAALVSIYAFSCILNTQTLGVFIASMASESKNNMSVRDRIIRVLTFPPTTASLLGLMLIPLSLNVGGEIIETLKLIGETTIPLSFIVVGLEYEVRNLRKYLKPLTLVALMRLVVSPLMALILLLALRIKLTSILGKVVLLESIMPPAVYTIILAREFNASPEEAATITTTLIIIAAIIILLASA